MARQPDTMPAPPIPLPLAVAYGMVAVLVMVFFGFANSGGAFGYHVETHQIIGTAFSAEVITPGVTTTGDVVWWMRERVRELGLGTWFQPSVSVQRRGVEIAHGGEKLPAGQRGEVAGGAGLVARRRALRSGTGLCRRGRRRRAGRG